MAGYKDRTIRLTFDEYTEPGDEMYIVMRNPKTVPLDGLRARVTSPEGTADDAATWDSYDRLARLIEAWRVYDAGPGAEDGALLEFPATAELFSRLPFGIQNAVADEVGKAMDPTRTPDTPAS